jgi:DNA (cytosine-5)-methyltransferase 1
MDYLSCFSGIAGLEGSQPPLAFCEIDPECQKVLKLKYPNIRICPDIRNFEGIKCDVVTGGWPCQDISIAGQQRGLKGENSGLFYAFVKVAINASAHTIIAENVSNLIKMQKGAVFKEVLRELVSNGYRYCAWRTLNAREFGLPHHRSRLLMIASKFKKYCYSIFRELPSFKKQESEPQAAGFYWTAGIHSINYSRGYVPTIKVGSSLSIPSPPAVHYGKTVRTLSTNEVLLLQGFEPSLFKSLKKNVIYRMAGNAVAQPMGKFVVDAVLQEIQINDIIKMQKPVGMFSLKDEDGKFDFPGSLPQNGIFEDEIRDVWVSKPANLAINLHEYLDQSNQDSLSQRAATGLLKRLDRSGQPCPTELRSLLETIRDCNA